MKSVAVFLSGTSAAIAGAFIRSCTTDFSSALSSAWCGVAPHQLLAAPAHAHCAGCVLIAGGLMLIALSPMLAPNPAAAAGVRTK